MLLQQKSVVVHIILMTILLHTIKGHLKLYTKFMFYKTKTSKKVLFPKKTFLRFKNKI